MRSSTFNHCLILCSTLFLPVVTGSAVASEELDINVAVVLTDEENINRGFFENDVRADTIQTISAGFRTELELSNLSAIFLHADYLNRQYSDYDLLSSDQFSFKADYVFQAGFRFADPVYTVSISLDEADYDSQLRDSTTLSVAAKLLKRFTTRIKTSIGLAYIQREADTNVFDIDSRRFFVLLDYSLTPKLSLYTSYTVLDGGSVSTITTTDPDVLAQQIGFATINEADEAGALLPDDAFGGVASGQFAYQNEATTTVFEIGTNFVFSQAQSIDVAVQSVNTELDTGLDYENYLLSVSYLARF